ncbi:TPA: PIN domain-containing protein [Escherichia coli]
MSYSIDAVVNMILANPKPVILFDTCALLDIVRSVDRDNISPEIISAASTLTSSDDNWLVSSKVVDTEWANNIEIVETATRNSVKNLHKRALAFKEALIHSTLADKLTYTKSFTSYDLEQNLKSISNDLRESLTLIESDVTCIQRASNRVIQCIAPASKGKSEYKDCLIIEHYIELGNRLKAAGFSNSIIFISSNKSDFGSPYDIREPIKTEFSNANITYIGDIKSAISLCA